MNTTQKIKSKNIINNIIIFIVINILFVGCIDITSSTTIPPKPKDSRFFNTGINTGTWAKYDNDTVSEAIRLECESEEFLYLKDNVILTGYWYTGSEKASSSSLIMAVCDKDTKQFIRYIEFKYEVLSSDEIMMNGSLYTTYTHQEDIELP